MRWFASVLTVVGLCHFFSLSLLQWTPRSTANRDHVQGNKTQNSSPSIVNISRLHCAEKLDSQSRFAQETVKGSEGTHFFPRFALHKKKCQNRFSPSKSPLETRRAGTDLETFLFDSRLGKNSSQNSKTTISELLNSVLPHGSFWLRYGGVQNAKVRPFLPRTAGHLSLANRQHETRAPDI